MNTISPNAMRLIKWSVFIQASFSALVLFYAFGSLLLGQVNPKYHQDNASVKYNLITFIISFWFPSPIFMLLTGEENESEEEDNQQSFTSLRDVPPPYRQDEHM